MLTYCGLHDPGRHSVASASVDDLSKSLTSILKLGDRTLVVRYVKALARLDLKTLKMLDLAQYGTDICLTLVRQY